MNGQVVNDPRGMDTHRRHMQKKGGQLAYRKGQADVDYAVPVEVIVVMLVVDGCCADRVGLPGAAIGIPAVVLEALCGEPLEPRAAGDCGRDAQTAVPVERGEEARVSVPARCEWNMIGCGRVGVRGGEGPAR